MFLAGCDLADRSLQQVRDRGGLRVATLFGPLSYYLGTEGPEGLDYELAQEFATRQKVKLQITAYPDLPSLQVALRKGQVDLAAAQLTIDASWGRSARAALSCYEMPQVFVSVRGRKRPRDLADLAGLRLLVADRSPQQQRALQLKLQYPTIQLVTRVPVPDRQWDDDLTADIADVALVDAADFALARNRQSRLVDAFGDPQSRPVHWILRTEALALSREVDGFCKEVGGPTLLARAMQRTLPATRRARRVPAAEFRALLDTRLPQLAPYFQEAAATHALDWRLLAALGYQESQWDPTAVSPNGALGLMMLMPATARSLGVSDPMDARDSIQGGARYLSEQRRRLPARIREPDRTLLALAIYNMGLGHVEDARVLTQQNGGNPDLWVDVRRYMPLLEQQYWYARASNGYARGSETVGLVENVRQYWALLQAYEPPPAPVLDDDAAEPVLEPIEVPQVPAADDAPESESPPAAN
jgi:membrane-bound lytic murein transglycosylase F